MEKIINIEDYKAQAIAIHGTQKKYNFSSLDEMIEKLEELERQHLLIDALNEIITVNTSEFSLKEIAKKALVKFKVR
jgi:hypothetical protein